MTYELSKKFKDAGFPQKKGDYQFPEKPLLLKNYEPTDRSYLNLVYGAYVPTLSELIEACGNPFMLV